MNDRFIQVSDVFLKKRKMRLIFKEKELYE